MTPIIAITGGIGSGKSVISALLRVMGYQVYDCDERAKWVMTHDPQLRSELIGLFGPATYLPDGELNKPHLSAAIFGHEESLRQMNACVHPAVARDMRQQIARLCEPSQPFFYESAILFESGFDGLITPDLVLTVSAPLELRIERAMRRDHTTRERVIARINSQMPQDEKERRADHVILNDERHSLIEQVNYLLTTIQSL